MPQADPHDGNLRAVHELAQMVHGVLAMRGVSRPVGDEDAVKVVRDFVDGVVVGKAGHARAAGDEAAQNVLLDAAVDHGDVHVAVGGRDMEGGFGADLAHEIDLLGVDEGFVLVCVVLFANRDAREGGALFAEEGDDVPSIDACNGGYAFSRRPLTQALHGGPMAVFLGKIGHHDARGLDVGRLEIAQEAVLVARIGGNAIVANQRLCKDEDLAAIRRVGQRLGVAYEGRGEDRFARNVGFGSKGLAVVDWAILRI